MVHVSSLAYTKKNHMLEDSCKTLEVTIRATLLTRLPDTFAPVHHTKRASLWVLKTATLLRLQREKGKGRRKGASQLHQLHAERHVFAHIGVHWTRERPPNELGFVHCSLYYSRALCGCPLYDLNAS